MVATPSGPVDDTAYAPAVKAARLSIKISGVCLVVAGALLSLPILYRQARAGKQTVATRLQQIGPRVEPIWRERMARTGLSVESPARLRVILLAIKSERTLHVFAAPDGGPPVWLATFPILAASGTAGPKLREGDRQVPEGLYAIESLNPNSRYHLALRVNYPSDEDRQQAKMDGRTDLGGDIMIHGGAGSVGCIALGDPAIEELFWLVATAGHTRVECVITPSRAPLADLTAKSPSWLSARYDLLNQRTSALLKIAPPQVR